MDIFTTKIAVSARMDLVVFFGAKMFRSRPQPEDVYTLLK